MGMGVLCMVTSGEAVLLELLMHAECDLVAIHIDIGNPHVLNRDSI